MITPEGSEQHPEAQALRRSTGFDMEELVGYILFVGVLLSLLFIVVGVIWNAVSTGRLGLDYTIQGMNYLHFTLTTLSLAFHTGLTASLMVSLGIILLLFTPYLRVFTSMIYFAFVQHNWKYTFFTFVVFAILTYSLLLR